MVENNNGHWNRLSFSTKRIFTLAKINSGKRSGKEIIDSIDLLAGLSLAHIGYSELEAIFKHLAVPFDSLLESLEIKPSKVRKYDLLEMEKNGQENSDFPEMDSVVSTILSNAFGLVKEEPNLTDKDGKIHFRILLGAFLQTDSPGLNLLGQLLRLNQKSLQNLRLNYRTYLGRSDIKKKYDAFLEENVIELVFNGGRLSGYVPDDQSNQDFVGIGAEINAFANMMAAKSLKPPLAIGLFGDWGSGKSFFMNSLRKKIGNITKQARGSKQPEKNISIYKNVVQIEFNAWHYIEGELWASLVEHIFQNLSLHQQGTDDELKFEIEERRSFWLNRLNENTVAVQKNKKTAEELTRKIKKKNDELKKLEKQRDEKIKVLEKIEWKDYLEELEEELTEKNLKDYKNLLEDFGISIASEKAIDFIDQFDQLIENYREGRTVFSYFSNMRWSWWLFLALLLFLSPIITFLIGLFYSIFELEASKMVEFFTTIGFMLGALTLFLKKVNNALRKKIETAKRWKQGLEQKYDQIKKKYNDKVQEAKSNLHKIEQDLGKLETENEELEEELIEIEKRINLVPQELLEEFITDRIESDDYRKHLGVVARVHQDFKRLSGLIDEQNRMILDGKPLEGIEAGHVVNRIILYIDDLDRCPPKQVIQVLQAVHLLLAFPLFVVVVAVDSRWLSQALQKHYEGLLVTSNEETSNDNNTQAGPRDYLEKIFQIPYWIKPLSDTAKTRIMEGLLRESLSEEEWTVIESDSEKKQQKKVKVNSGFTEDIIPFSVEDREDLNPKSLEITLEEVQFMDELKSILPDSPRAVKRFINVYRIAKAMALNFKPNFTNEEEFAPYKIVLFTLATLIGLPRLTSLLWKAIKSSKVTTLGDLLKTLQEEKQALSATLNEDISALNQWLDLEEHQSWRALPIDNLTEWGPLIMRFTWSTPFGADW